MDRTGQAVLKLLLPPFLLFSCLWPPVVGALIVFSATEYGGALYRYAQQVYGRNDVVPGADGTALVTILVVVALVSGSLSRALMLLEGLSRPRLNDHLRHGRAALEVGP